MFCLTAFRIMPLYSVYFTCPVWEKQQVVGDLFRLMTHTKISQPCLHPGFAFLCSHHRFENLIQLVNVICLSRFCKIVNLSCLLCHFFLFFFLEMCNLYSFLVIKKCTVLSSDRVTHFCCCMKTKLGMCDNTGNPIFCFLYCTGNQIINIILKGFGIQFSAMP